MQFSYRNNAYYLIHHGQFSKHVLELAYTEYEVHRSIIRVGAPIQLNPLQNLVFLTLTTDETEGEVKSYGRSPIWKNSSRGGLYKGGFVSEPIPPFLERKNTIFSHLTDMSQLGDGFG